MSTRSDRDEKLIKEERTIGLERAGESGTGSPESGEDSHREPEKPVSMFWWRFMLVFGTFIYSSYTILIHLSEIIISFVLLSRTAEVSQNGFQWPPIRSAIPFAIPALLYFFNNNLAIRMQLEMDPASYQMFGNFKILSTAILYRIIIKRPISLQQWIALGMLVTAGLSNSYAGLTNEAKSATSAAGGTADSHSGQIRITPLGLLMITAYCTVSGLAGVYTEYILKKRLDMSLHYQNILLYSFGIALNASYFFLQVSTTLQPGESLSLFRGFSVYTWLLIVDQAICGLIISAVMKHSSNIARLFLISGAMLVTTVFSMIIFGLQLNLYYCFAFVLVLVAFYLYHNS